MYYNNYYLMTSRVSHLNKDSIITKEHIAMHTNLILPFKPALYFNTLVIKCFKSIVLSRNSYCNTIGQFCFVNFTTCMAHPLLKLKCCILLVMYNWLNGFYRVMNSKYSITLLFFGSKKLKSSRTCLIGY